MHSSAGLHQATGVSVYLSDSRVDLFQFRRVVVLFVSELLLLEGVAVQGTHDLDMFIAFFRLFVCVWVIEANDH